MIKILPFLILTILCLGIVLVCICRLNMIRVDVHRWVFAALYIALAYFAGGTLAEALSTDKLPAPWVFAGLCAAGASLLATSDRWSKGPSWDVLKPSHRIERRSRA